MDVRSAMSAIAGAGGFKVLTSAGSPHTIPGLVVGARTTQAGITVDGDQYAGHKNPEAVALSGYEIESSGQYDPLWVLNPTITVPSGEVKIILGEKAP